MTFNWRQAMTSAIIGAIAAAVVSLASYGTLDRDHFALAAAIGVALGASRLIELRKP